MGLRIAAAYPSVPLPAPVEIPADEAERIAGWLGLDPEGAFDLPAAELIAGVDRAQGLGFRDGIAASIRALAVQAGAVGYGVHFLSLAGRWRFQVAGAPLDAPEAHWTASNTYAVFRALGIPYDEAAGHGCATHGRDQVLTISWRLQLATADQPLCPTCGRALRPVGRPSQRLPQG